VDIVRAIRRQRSQLTLRIENLEPLLRAGWDICHLSKLPQETQHRIRETTIEQATPYKTAGGCAFPDRIVVGVVTK